MNQKNQKTQMAPARNDATLHELYVQLKKRQAARERQARLICVGLLPSVLALALHLSW